MDQEMLLKIKTDLWHFVLEFGPKLLYTIVCLAIGVILIKLIRRLLKRVLNKSGVELSLKTFIESLSTFLLYGLLFFVIGTVIGIKSTSFLAIFGAAGIAIGLALQGSLSNFAGGLLILIFKPFKVGDLIQVNDKLGDVVKLDILYTRIRTFDGRMITMPNGNVSNSDVDNRTMEKYRRIDLKLKFTYDTDFEEIRRIVVETMRKNPKVIKDMPIDLWMDDIGEYEVKVVAHSWVESVDYWPMYWKQLESVKKALDQAGIEIPYPRRTVFQGQPKDIS
ncbi:mechanosensitive ion channel family protein [bacterium]|jgi:small conductance mechanosensitive channel|nr:mechanosensitive ion channel family protein [bacterium]